MNILATLAPKSDQLNADDLIGKTITITVTKVTMKAGDEQPVSIFFKGDNGKPYKPGKSMRRVLVAVWGPDASQYVGKSMMLYRDAEVKFGGLEVGGIRISHMSGLDKQKTLALTATRGVKKGHTVKPLQVDAKQKDGSRDDRAEGFTWFWGAKFEPRTSATPQDWRDDCIDLIGFVPNVDAAEKWSKAMEPHIAAVEQVDAEAAQAVRDAVTDRIEALSASAGEPQE
ncbi:hypothetical protein [Roseomonas mucosa]|uniref:hypothetical protein n=1 Tax=Roseomonas mucosa TaxID=207340 RepID=UPI0022457E47|nr:hypothetical protein [Roseomonas mucosa]UZO91717.1 Hypothetical protein RMP42_05956 [Roseomonas mucosa]